MLSCQLRHKVRVLTCQQRSSLSVCCTNKIVAIIFFYIISAATDIAIEQKETTSWVREGKTYYRYSAIVTNKSSKTLKNLKLSVSQLYGSLWGLSKYGDSYVFPAWINSLPTGKSLEFVYIHTANSPAVVSVSSYTLD